MTARRTFLALAGVMAAPAILRAQGSLTPLRFTLDWALQGNHGMWTLADERGLFRQNGLSVRIDRGFGSGDTAVKVATGAYDLGFTDISTAVKFNAENPSQRLVSIYQVFDRTAAALVTLKGRGIDKPGDVVGRLVGAPEGEGSRVLFPVFARAAGIDASRVRWSGMAPNLRDTMLAQRQVDAVTGFLFTTYFNLVAMGVPESDILAWPYAENGLDICGSAIVARADWLERNGPQAAAFVRASMAGLQLLIAEPEAGMQSLLKREPLFDVALEKRRWEMTRDRSILTPNVRRDGLGSLEPARAELLISASAEAFGIANPPSADSMFTQRYLPPMAERRV
ncbi:ABC transporter substrate-binding protein [Humitalea sp. 24SJ18S-53]|uniref:ABC transporter substrate-binding protein n=1 Tax=Humitalea sp. 24SJ18S-53 TaxID=3422307 RepID=UPI003D6733BF